MGTMGLVSIETIPADVVPALTRPDLLAPATLAALRELAATDPVAADRVLVVEIDPEMADTATLTAAWDLSPDLGVNCVVVAGRRDGEERVAACCVRSSTRADVNGTARRLLDVRKATFLPMDRAVGETGMEYGGITPIGLPAGWRVLVDASVLADEGLVMIGSGVRRSKVMLPGRDLALFGVEAVEGLGVPIPA